MMIKAEELRHNNLFLNSKGQVEIFENIYVDIVNPQVSHVFQEIDGDTLDQINPIPLTAEWLERCGFVNSGKAPFIAYRMNVNSADELCWYGQDGFLRYQTQGDGFTRGLRHIQHVHQLQNWYYAFTGEELQIKP